MLNMLNLWKAGINWAKQLKKYQKVMNKQPMEVLENLFPFQIFYGRESSKVTQRIPEGFCVEESIAQTSSVLPSGANFAKKNSKIVLRLQSKGSNATLNAKSEVTLLQYTLLMKPYLFAFPSLEQHALPLNGVLRWREGK